jgi:thiamine monophosphate kinase
LQELRRSNHGIGFEVELNKALIHGEAIRYSKEFEVPIENLLFLGGGEEFIHLFLMNEGDYQSAQKLVASREGRLFKIGEVVAEEGIYGLREGKRIRLEGRGYEHFT